VARPEHDLPAVRRPPHGLHARAEVGEAPGAAARLARLYGRGRSLYRIMASTRRSCLSAGQPTRPATDGSGEREV
jgi:hypothetical protein